MRRDGKTHQYTALKTVFGYFLQKKSGMCNSLFQQFGECRKPVYADVYLL